MKRLKKWFDTVEYVLFRLALLILAGIAVYGLLAAAVHH